MKEVYRDFETVQAWEAATVNVKEKLSIYCSPLQSFFFFFNLSFHLYVPVEGSGEDKEGLGHGHRREFGGTAANMEEGIF